MFKWSKYQRQVMSSNFLGFLLERMDASFMGLAMASIVMTLHISNTQASLLPAVTVIGALIGGTLFGILADKYGRVKTLSWTIIIYAIGTAGMFFTNNFTLLIICRIIIGIGESGEYGIAMAMLCEAFSKKHMGKVSAATGVAGQIGAVIASLLSAFILPDWHALFLIGIIPVVLAIYIRLKMPESNDFKRMKKDAQKNNEKSGQIKTLFKNKETFLLTFRLMIMWAVQIAGYTGLMTFLPSILGGRLGINVKSSSLWMIATILGMTAGMMVFGYCQDKFGSRKSYMIYYLGAILLSIANSQLIFIILGALLGFFSDGMYSGFGKIINLLYPTSIRASANNIIMNGGKTISFPTTILFGWMLDRFGKNGTSILIFLAAAYLIAMLLMLSIKKLTLKKEI